MFKGQGGNDRFQRVQVLSVFPITLKKKGGSLGKYIFREEAVAFLLISQEKGFDYER